MEEACTARCQDGCFANGEPTTVLKYGELIVLGYNDSLPNSDKARTKSHFALCQRTKANGVKPSTVHKDCNPQAATAITMLNQHSISYTSQATTVVVECAADNNTDMFQIGRSPESPIDFVVTDTVPPKGNSEISRFACRIICQRSPPYTARIYAAGFDSSKNIFLNENAAKWETDGQMDGMTTNGVLVNLHGFTQDSRPGLWREISVCGNAYTLRKTNWLGFAKRRKMVHGESQELVDGSLIDLRGVTLLWRTAEGLARTPTLEALLEELYVERPRRSVGSNSLRHKEVQDDQPWAYLQCGHVDFYHGGKGRSEAEERECPICRVRGPYVPLQMGSEVGLFLDAAPLTHAFVPCGHVCSEKTATFWSQMSLPYRENSFHAACPFCVQRLTGDTGYIRLVWASQQPLDQSEAL